MLCPGKAWRFLGIAVWLRGQNFNFEKYGLFGGGMGGQVELGKRFDTCQEVRWGERGFQVCFIAGCAMTFPSPEPPAEASVKLDQPP